MFVLSSSASQAVQLGYPLWDEGAYALQPIASGFDQPVDMAQPPDSSGRWFVASRSGLIWIVDGDTVRNDPFLDLSEHVTPRTSTSAEYGLHGLAFDPEFTRNGYIYVTYEGQNEVSQLERYRVSATDPNRADPESAETILSLPQPFMEHTVAQLVFGPDGYLYIGSGDGGLGKPYVSDAFNLGQRNDELYGAILRIDVRNRMGNRAYTIPTDNPFVEVVGAAQEVWVYGLRNPHSFNFDALTGDLYIGDVGLETWEEINIVPTGSSGQNFGWAYYEGPGRVSLTVRTPYQYGVEIPQPDNPEFPALVYARNGRTQCAVMGGYVYRGRQLPELEGVYIYGDFCSGDLNAAWPAGGLLRDLGMLVDTDARIVGFAQDEHNELYIVDYLGTLYRLAAQSATVPDAIPQFAEATPVVLEGEG